MKKMLMGVVGVAGLLLAGAASAAIDVSGATTVIGDGSAAAQALGVAALAVMGTAAVFKYIRRAL